MADVTGPRTERREVCDYTLTHLIRAVERGRDNFVFDQAELVRSFPELDPAAPCDVGVLAGALGPGWGVHGGTRNVLTRQCDKRVALARLREMKSC